jgi:hypothetical protein
MSAVMSTMLAGCLIAAPTPAPPQSPYPEQDDHYQAVRDLIAGKGDLAEVTAAIDESLEKLLLPGPPPPNVRRAPPLSEKDQLKHLQSLLTLRAAAVTFSKAKDVETAQSLLGRPQFCSRFLHALDDKDSLNKALDILKQLKAVDPKRFERWQEFCIAFSVVWDNFEGHWWCQKTVPREENLMLSTYKHYIDNEQMLLIDPGQMPFELAVYVVGTRLRASERQWILANYRPQIVEPGSLYKSVPWTQRLSPAHKKGDDLEYTLANIKQHGGVCMEQAYFSESVCRMFGLPAVYTHGRGERGGHAWVGTLVARPRPHWDFSFGRYYQDRYYKGEVDDPTCPGREIPDSVVAMTGALLTAGSIDKIEEGYTLCDAARWLTQTAKPDADEATKKRRDDARHALMVRSLKTSPYNANAWLFLGELAKSGAIDAKAAQFWADQMFTLTVNEFPDFTIECLQGFLACIDKPQEKARILSRLYTIISRIRPDLAADVKVAEGDLWLSQSNVDNAIESYLYPLVNFSKDQHILETAQKRLDGLTERADKSKLEKSYRRVLALIDNAPNQRDQNLAGIRAMIEEKLAALSGTPSASPKIRDR